MSEQNFHQPVNNVAGRDFIQNNYSSEDRLLLGPQKWATKHYIAGNAITAGWLAFFLFMAFLVCGLAQILSSIHGLFTLAPVPNALLMYLRLLLIAVLGLFVAAARQVASPRGFIGIPHTQIGIARDINRRVFVGQPGGKGSLCPQCQVKLQFHDLGSSPILRCTRNSEHWWAFDFTAVKD